MGERTEIYEREKLYQEIWKEPVLVVAKRYGVSNVALAKACRALAVPLPPRGYWAKVRLVSVYNGLCGGWIRRTQESVKVMDDLRYIRTWKCT